MRKKITGPRKTAPPEKPIDNHDHQWRLCADDPVLEDGSAYFTEKCQWVEILGSSTSEKLDETFYEEGAECDETRHYRMDIAWVEQKRDDAPSIYYLGSEIGNFTHVLEQALPEVERSGNIVEFDEHRRFGYVTAETDDWRVKYKADQDPQIDPKPR